MNKNSKNRKRKVYKRRIYIGIVGQIAAGKEVFAEYLIRKYGFTAFSLSTVIHEELKERGTQSFTRKTLQDVGDQLRQKFGEDILAKRAIEMLRDSSLEILSRLNSPAKGGLKQKVSKNFSSSSFHLPSIIITGIRNPAEVRFFKKIPSFYLIAIKAKRKIRFERVLKRGKPWDPKTWKEFLKLDRRDFGIGQGKSGQQVGRCMKMADYTLTNNKDVVSFYDKIEKLISKLKVQNSKPELKT